MVPKSSTTVRCSISQIMLDDKTVPVAMPDNRIYSLESVNKIVEENNGVFVCPDTKTTYQVNEASKIFFL